ncbi:hypothetical protein ETSB_0817 [cyanobacterium endosymbiont of Epithemia turgida isolate EtSB Lake Yunoko]|nr:hypothetical protein ETSB_0817 [cyanobacterium endosymbiont of Epithemia turgida isolate EtSB Lake Yunoko]
MILEYLVKQISLFCGVDSFRIKEKINLFMYFLQKLTLIVENLLVKFLKKTFNNFTEVAEK